MASTSTSSARHAFRPRQQRANLRLGREQPLKPHAADWRVWVLLGCLVAGLVLIVVPNRAQLAWYFNRPVSAVRIATPLQRVAEDEVKALLAAYMGEGYFSLDVAGIKRQLEGHPWIANVDVRRIWPGRLELSVTEEVAIARWGQHGLLNQYAQVFTPPSLEGSGSLPLLAGPDGTHTEVMEGYRALSQMLFPTGLRIEQLTMSGRSSLEMVVTGGTRLILGKRDARERLKRFVAIYDSQIGNDIAVIERIDLRYSNGFSVKRREQETIGVAAR